MTTSHNGGKYPPAPRNPRTGASRPAAPVPTASPATQSSPEGALRTNSALPSGGPSAPPANSRWAPPPSARAATSAVPRVAPRRPLESHPAATPRPPRPLAAIELFQKAQALLLALPAQPPVLRREGVELIAALGAGYLNGDAASLIPALNETRARCGRLLALLTALCPAQLGAFETQLHGLHRACGYFVRYLQEQQRSR